MANDQYQVLNQLPRTKYDPISRQNVEGWDVTYKDLKTNTLDIFFIPADQHGPDQVNAIIMAKLQRIRAVADL